MKITKDFVTPLICKARNSQSNQVLICYARNSLNNQGLTKLNDYSPYIAKMNLLLSATATFVYRLQHISDNILLSATVMFV